MLSDVMELCATLFRVALIQSNNRPLSRGDEAPEPSSGPAKPSPFDRQSSKNLRFKLCLVNIQLTNRGTKK